MMVSQLLVLVSYSDVLLYATTDFDHEKDLEASIVCILCD